MAENDAPKRTRFPCLSWARYLAAGMVSLFLLAVLVRVIISVAPRPENTIRLSVLHGHVKADALWSKTERLIDGGNHEVVVAYSAEKNVALRLRLTAENTGGGADINCSGTTIRFFDLPEAPLFTRMVEIAMFDLPEQFLVKRRSSHMLRKWLTVNDTGVLRYIARTYGGRSSFEAMFQVRITVSSTKPAKRRRLAVHYCWPVTVGVDFPSTFSQDVTCKPSQDIDNPIDYELPAPAPAPTEAAAV